MIAHWSPLEWTRGDHGRSAYGRLLPDQRNQTGCSLQCGKPVTAALLPELPGLTRIPYGWPCSQTNSESWLLPVFP
jgi:hypothetical protein